MGRVWAFGALGRVVLPAWLAALPEHVFEQPIYVTADSSGLISRERQTFTQ